MIGIYVHIPFCRRVCPYCDFVRQPIDGAVPRPFLDALSQEIAACDGPDQAATVYIGGGTPSLLSPHEVQAVLGMIRQRFRLVSPDDRAPEITLEANPDDVTSELADAWRDGGVNRVSLGVQSFADPVLAYLGRRHDAERARQACAIIAERFDNWTLDLMFGPFPEHWDASLDECRRWRPRHVSAYGLTYEPGTPFGARAHEAVDDETYLALYRRIAEVLDGYDHYEISNYAQPGYQARHNLIYWRNEAYAGFGPGAYSFIGGVRSRNPARLEAYLAAPGRKEEALALSEREVRLETLIQHLRLAEGIARSAYTRRFGRDLWTDYGEPLDKLIARGLLTDDGERIRPTPTGFELNSDIGIALVD